MSNWSFILVRKLVCRGIWVRGVVLFLAFWAALGGESFGIDTNPVGRGTLPASSVLGGRVGAGSVYRGGLVRSPTTADNRGNLIVSGNVRGGRHFRGIIPYESRYDFELDLPSSSLDSFLRYSAGSEDIRGGSDRYITQPYYSSTRRVTRVDNRSIIQPGGTRIEERTGSTFLPSLLRQEATVRGDLATSYTGIQRRPLSMTPSELEQVILDETQAFLEGNIRYPLRGKLAGEQYRSQVGLLPGEPNAAGDKAAELKRSLLLEDELSQLPTRTEPGSLEGLKTVEEEREKLKSLGLGTEVPESDTGEMGEEVSIEQEDVFGVPDAQADIYEQMKWQISNMQRVLESTPAGLGVERAKKIKATDETRRDEEEELFSAVTGRQREIRDRSAEEEKKQRLVSPQEESSFLKELPQMGSEDRGVDLKDDVATKASEILGEHKTFASFADDKFNRYMRAAEEYLKRGRYYRAADAYTLASIYKSDDPLAYAGKSHALFAAGEYMSSALFLSRALEIFPEYARFKIDLVAMVGDKDKLESRIANVEEWLDESDAAELQFLLGYIYYQMGRQEEAERAVYAAFEKMPESPAVAALKKAVTGAAE